MDQASQQAIETKKVQEDVNLQPSKPDTQKKIEQPTQQKKQPTETEPDQTKKQKEKTVTLTVKEMNKIRKQLQKLQKMQVHKKQNEQLRAYIISLQQKNEQRKKSETSMQAMQETIKHLQRMVDQSSKNQQKAKRQEAKSKQILKHERQMLNSSKLEVEELRKVASQFFILKQEVSRLNNQCVSLREAKDQYPKVVKKIQELEVINQQLKRNFDQKKKELQFEKELKQKLQIKLQSVMQTNKDLTKQKNKIICEKEELCGELQALKQEMQDERMDSLVRQKKTSNEIKQLKITLHQEHEKLKITQHQLIEAKKNMKQAVDLDKVKLSSLDKEDLFNLLEESEMKIVTLKMAINDAGDKIQQLSQKLKQKDKSVMSLARQLTKDYPNMDESQGMDYVQKDIIQMGKLKKDDWGEIVEKVMIQNLRLKSSVTALGQEYNSMMRQKK